MKAPLLSAFTLGAWTRSLGCDCVEPGVVNRIEQSEHGLFIPCGEGRHYFCDENIEDFEIVTPLWVTAQEREALKDAVDIAFVDDDAPIYDGVEGKFIVAGLKVLLSSAPAS